MRGHLLAAVLVGAAQALAWGAPAYGQASDQPPQMQLPEATLEPMHPSVPSAPEVQPTPDVPLAAPEAAPVTPEAVPAAPETSPGDQPLTAAPAPADPVVALIRAKLADPAVGNDADADDRAALERFYAARTGPALWITEMGFSAKGQQVLFEIAKADDWGLDASAFDLPQAEELPANAEAEALAEIKLDLAILKYARFARGGRLTPAKISELFDQTPPLREPETVLAEIEAADAPDAYLRSLHPSHEQFQRLRQALLKARGPSEEGAKPANDKDIKRLIINMERWRWMPEELGSIYVLNNSPAFMLFVIKDGKTIFADKTLVGTIGYATPVFTAPMTNIVFNPDWVAPETVVKENIIPPLQRGSYSILKIHKLYVSYNGTPVDPTRVDWNRVNPKAYTFSQKAGPANNLGKVKFSFPNRHDVYLHDTLPVRKKYFKVSVRMIGHECVRMERPVQFADVLLAEANGWPDSRVKELWDKGNNSSVPLEKKIPVHMVYFTAVVNDDGKVETFGDVYGLDRKLAAALFDDTTGFPQPPPEPPKRQDVEADATPVNRNAGTDGIMRSMQGFFGD
jgi:murein L,D-transpeptidase YcbB/YkuD